MRQVSVPEVELLLLCARMQLRATEVTRASLLLDRRPDWSRLESFARSHGLIPLLHRSLSGLAPGRVPSDVIERLRRQSAAIRVHNLVLTRELSRAMQALEAAGVIAAPYKGPALAAFLFQDVALRQISDIDLLVRPSDARAARRALLKQGFGAKRQLSPIAEAVAVRFHCDFSFTSLEGQAAIELNWRIAPRYWLLPEIPTTAWNGLGRLVVAGIDVPWFRPEDLLFVLCMHGSKHQWELLKWLVDVAELLRIRSDIDWREVTKNAREAGAERLLDLGLFLANDLLDAPLPPRILEAIRRKPSVTGLAQEICENLLVLEPCTVSTWARLDFLARAADRLKSNVSRRALIPAYFVLHRLIRPCAAALRRSIPS